MTAKWPGALSFVDNWLRQEPIKLTLADAVRLQSVLWHSFVTWYATGEVTGKMFKHEYVGPDVVTFPKWR